MSRDIPTLCFVVPCYNEEDCLPKTGPVFFNKLLALIEEKKVKEDSVVLFVDDGSSDKTWKTIEHFFDYYDNCKGIRFKMNRGHQNAVMAGLMEAAKFADVSVSIDVDLQDDIEAVDEMLSRYQEGFDVVCGVRSERRTDSFLKRFTAQAYYKLLRIFAKTTIIYNHADYRLLSREAMQRLFLFHGDNLFLRGLVTRLELPTIVVEYPRSIRVDGESKYTIRKMVKLAMNGVRSGKMKMSDTPRPEDSAIITVLE